MIIFTRAVLFSLICFFFFCATESALAQKPTASPQAGCAPLQINFTATGSPTTNTWDFGDGGGGAQNTANPDHYYSTPGDYVVSFTNSANVTDTIIIHIYPKPNPGFSAISSTDSCTGLLVYFQDNSTGGGGSAITSWTWNFGDPGSGVNNVSNLQNPSHQFNSVNAFDISLKVTDANGCDSTVQMVDMVRTSFINAIILTDPSPSKSCIAPFTVLFSDTTSSSTAGQIISHIWSWGNGDSSFVATDSVTYTSAGVYTASLTLIDNYNCRRKVTQQVVINNTVADFTILNDLPPPNGNDTVCKNVNFISTSIAAGNVTFQWMFGDGINTNIASGNIPISGVAQTSGIYKSPVHTYPNPDPYTDYIVTLIVTSDTLGLQCTDTLMDTIWVDGVRANFTSSPTYSCEMPFVVTYDGSISTNAAQWDWTFLSDTDFAVSGQNTASGVIVKDTIINIDTNEYTVHWMELFDVELLVTSPDGCVHDTVFQFNDTIYKPTALFMPDTVYGCAPLTVTFYDSSKSIEDIVQWYWSFGDGTDTIGGDELDTIIHTYNNPGIDSVFLIIENDSGCIDTSYAIVINIGNPPSPNFSASTLLVCAGDSVDFTDLTPSSDSVDTWHYITDGILMWSCKGDPNPSWAYSSDVGFFDVTLQVGFRGCFSDTTFQNLIEVKGPIANFRYEGNCIDPYTYNFFADSSKGYTSLDWNFGDGTTLNGTLNSSPTHLYSARGDYSATLIAYNNTTGCDPDTETIIIRVREIIARMELDSWEDTLFCSGVAASFNADTSQDVYNYCNRGYRWDWNDGTQPEGTDSPVIQHPFDTSGDFQVRLIVTDTNGCTDTFFQKVTVHKIEANFAMDTTVSTVDGDTLLVCVPQVVQFTDMTVSDTILSSWYWQSWGIRLPDTIVFNHDTSVSTNPFFDYDFYNSSSNAAGVGYYMVELSVTDTVGCIDTVRYYIKQSYPDSAFSISDPTLCVGQAPLFNAANNNSGTTYLWDFGDGGTGTVDSITYVYDNLGPSQIADTFTVSLTVTDSVGCKGTKSLSNLVKVQAYPEASYYFTALDENDNVVVVTDTTVLCWPQEEVRYHDTSYFEYSTINKWYWDLGLGTGILPGDSVAIGFYSDPDVYYYSLVVETSNGCRDTISDSLSIIGPLANFTNFPNTICRDDSILFALKDTADLFGWSWDFDDGTTDDTGSDSIWHTYDFHPLNGVVLPKLIAYGKGGRCPVVIQKNINIYQVIADFAITDNDNNGVDTAHCKGYAFTFSNQSSTTPTPDSLIWDMGNGTIKIGPDQIYIYSTADTFTVGLFIQALPSGSSKSCYDTIFKQVIVYPLPEALATGGDTCKGDSVQLTASGAQSYLWSPGGDTIPDPMVSPASTTIFTVTVTDGNGCEDSDTALVQILQPPLPVNLDTAIHIGETVPFNFDLGSNYTYTWTPATTGLTCINCPNPTAQPMDDTPYEVVIEDNLGCFSIVSSYYIEVLPGDSLDFPDAFTPEASVNNIAFVKGWGIKSLLEFKIYNRWGQLVYENPGDLNQGWDGTYLGKIQNMDTYVYYIKAEMYLRSDPKTRQGHLLLIR